MSDLRDPLKVARGAGSARSGLNHFMIQRLTAVALAILGIWFLYLVIGLVHADHATAMDVVARPWNALLLIVFTIVMFWHAQLGIQVIIEDYVHTRGWAIVLQTAVKFACFIAAAAGVFAVLRVALGN